MTFAHINFNTLGSIGSFPYPTAIGLETRDNPIYHLEGRERKDTPHCIFQYTLSG